MADDTLIYGSANPAVLARIPRGARRMLDVGCGDGTLGAAVRPRGVAEVWGITHSAGERDRASGRLDRVIEADLGHWTADAMPAGGRDFDVVVCSHVLEHLADPVRVLRELRSVLAPGGVLVGALPNVLYWRQRLEFLRGRFRYTRGGLMDATHLRFFDAAGARRLLVDGGWCVVDFVADGAFPGSRLLGALGRLLDRCALRGCPGLFGFQFVFVARPASESAPQGSPALP